MADTTNELHDFISESLRQIREAHKEKKLRVDRGIVRFEIAVTKKETAEGKLEVKVLGIAGAKGEGQVSHENASKIMFETHIDQSEKDDYIDNLPQNRNDWSIG